MDEESVSKMVKIQRHLEGTILEAQVRAEAAKGHLKTINTVLARCCKHCWIDDEFELFQGLEPKLVKVTFCSVCDLTAEQVAEL
jgi:hypothetical protein